MNRFKKYLLENGNISEAAFEKLADLLIQKQFEKGSFLLQAGEICKHAIFVETGLLRAYTIDKNGKEHVIQFAAEGWIISDRGSAFFNEPSAIFIDAIEDSKVVLIDENFNCNAAEISAFFGLNNERALQKHIYHLQQRINLLISATAEERYLHFINLYPDLTLRVPQWMIASYLGITAESLSRVRRNLADKNFNG